MRHPRFPGRPPPPLSPARRPTHTCARCLQTLDGKHVLELPLNEVNDVQGVKEDAILEFHVDDGSLRGKEDALSSVTIVIPEENEDFPGARRLDPSTS